MPPWFVKKLAAFADRAICDWGAVSDQFCFRKHQPHFPRHRASSTSVAWLALVAMARRVGRCTACNNGRERNVACLTRHARPDRWVCRRDAEISCHQRGNLDRGTHRVSQGVFADHRVGSDHGPRHRFDRRGISAHHDWKNRSIGYAYGQPAQSDFCRCHSIGPSRRDGAMGDMDRTSLYLLDGMRSRGSAWFWSQRIFYPRPFTPTCSTSTAAGFTCSAWAYSAARSWPSATGRRKKPNSADDNNYTACAWASRFSLVDRMRSARSMTAGADTPRMQA
jgi:hypothetical protein